MSKLNDELVDAAIAYGDAVKALKRAENARAELLDSVRLAEVAMCDAEIVKRRAQRALDQLTKRIANDQLLEESFQRDGVLMQAGAA